MEQKSKSNSPSDLSKDFGINPKGVMNFNSYHLDLNFHQLRIIQLSLVYFDSMNRGNLCRNYSDDFYYTLRQIDRLISEDVI